MVVAPLVDMLLPTREIRGSNPVIGKFHLLSFVLKLCIEDENKEKRGCEWANLKRDMEKTNWELQIFKW